MTALSPIDASTASEARADDWMEAHEQYLALRLEWLRLLLQRKVRWLREQGWDQDPLRDYQQLVVSDAQADRILGRSTAASEAEFNHQDEAARVLGAKLAQVGEKVREAESQLAELGGVTPLHHLQHLAELTEFEEFVLFCALAFHLDAGLGRLYAYLQDDSSLDHLTPGLSLMLAGPGFEPGWTSFLPDAPLVRYRLIDPMGSEPPHPDTARPIRIDTRMANYLRGINHVDERLQGMLSPLEVVPLAGSQYETVTTVSAWLEGGAEPGLNLIGRPGSGRRSVAAEISSRVGINPAEVDIAALAADARREDLIRLMSREAMLLPAAFYVEAATTEGEDPARAAVRERLVDSVAGLVIVGSRRRWEHRRNLMPVTLPSMDAPESLELWQSSGVDLPERDLAAIAQQFHLSPHSVVRVAAEARAEADLGEGQPEAVISRDRLWDLCRTHAGRNLGELGQRLEPAATWDQLVLGDRPRSVLEEMRDQVHLRSQVYGEWAWDSRLSRGRGISALFSGPSGTGKTMAAEILAGDLRLDLYRIDLSSVVSKYIGETEKNLRRVFDAAEQGGAILFFDEADALFGKRTEVKDSHDRYANIETNYLLQRMEDYRGLAILASNRKGDLDEAFLRRIRFVVTFPFPDPASRRRIWEVVFPSDVPRGELDYTGLARMSLSGGNIRNVALNASFLAAGEGSPVEMRHIVGAARREYDKIEKLVTRAEFGEYYPEDES